MSGRQWQGGERSGRLRGMGTFDLGSKDSPPWGSGAGEEERSLQVEVTARAEEPGMYGGSGWGQERSLGRQSGA